MRPAPLAMILFAALLAAPTTRAEAPPAAQPAPQAPTVVPLTESQARSRIEEIGYTQVSDLRMDAQGLWHGRASRNGDPREVALDALGELQDSWELAALTMFDRETGEPRAAGLSPTGPMVQISR